MSELKYNQDFKVGDMIHKIVNNIILIEKEEIPDGQVFSKCYSRDELITISRNAPIFVNAYEFNGMFIEFSR
jgi:hypothetical protein